MVKRKFGINRFWGYGAPILKRICANYKLFSIEGYDPLYLKRWRRVYKFPKTERYMVILIIRPDPMSELSSAANFIGKKL
jgi:hypothetical protein